MSGSWATGWVTGDVVTAAEFKKGMGAIYDTTLGVASASVDITGIVADYAHLRLVAYLRGDTAATAIVVNARFNNDSAANYDVQSLTGTGSGPSASESFGQTSVRVGRCAAASAGANLFGIIVVDIPHYAGSANNKIALSHCADKIGTATTNIVNEHNSAAWRSSAAISRITLLPSAGNFAAGSRVTLYGMGA